MQNLVAKLKRNIEPRMFHNNVNMDRFTDFGYTNGYGTSGDQLSFVVCCHHVFKHLHDPLHMCGFVKIDQIS